MKVQIEIDCTPEEARTFMGLPDVEAMHYVRTLLVSAAIALLLIGLVWALISSTRFMASIPRSYVQRRAASVVGGAVFLVLLVQLVNGALVRAAITLISREKLTKPSAMAGAPSRLANTASASSRATSETIS